MPDDPTDPKPWYQSKALWLGVVLTVVGTSSYFSTPEHTPTLNLASISEAVGGIATVILRVWFTSAPVQGTRRAARAIEARAERSRLAVRFAQRPPVAG
jgi:hypothetical protein